MDTDTANPPPPAAQAPAAPPPGSSGTPASGTSSSPKRLGRILLATIVLANVLMALVATLSLQTSYRQNTQRAYDSAQNLATLLDRHVDHIARTIDVALLAVVDEIDRERAYGMNDPHKLQVLLRSARSRLPEVQDIRITQQDGTVLWLDSSLPTAHTSQTRKIDQQLMSELRGEAESGLQLTRPFTDTGDGNALVGFARRYATEDGVTSGMVVASVSVAHLQGHLDALQLGQEGMAWIRYGDFGLIAHAPAGPATQTGSTSVDPAVRLLANEGRTEATLDTVEEGTGIHRIVSFRRLPTLPLVVGVGLGRGDYLADWYSQVIRSVSFMAVFLVCTGWFSVLIWRAHLRQVKSVRQVAEANQALQTSVTELKERDQALQSESAKVRTFLQNASDGVHILDVNGLVIEASDSFCDMLGYPRNQVLGMHFKQWEVSPAAERLPDKLNHAYPEGQRLVYQSQYRRRDRKVIDVEVAAYASMRGGEWSLFNSARDITERRQGEQELERYKNRLEELVSARTNELLAARDDAQRLASAKSDFLAHMSHEIRTPLNAVLGFAQIGARDGRDTPAHRSFARIIEAGRHLLGVINDILDFSKIESGRLQIEHRPFRLAAVVDDATQLVMERVLDKGLSFSIRIEPDVPDWVAGDPLRLEQVLVNLLSNAQKFTSHGEVGLRIWRDPNPNADWIYLCVSDTGIGMTPEQVGRLFKPFEQADASTTRKFGGTGLGLAISHNLVTLMGGRIDITSSPGAGSKFTIKLSLPVAERGVEADPANLGTGQRLAGLRVLAADDVEMNRLLLEDLLTHEGANVTLAESGIEALQRLEEYGVIAFDVVLMDVQMPEMDGLEATRRLHDMAPGLPVVALTAHALVEEREKALAAGMCAHLTKPIDPDTLVATVRRVVHDATGWLPPSTVFGDLDGPGAAPPHEALPAEAHAADMAAIDPALMEAASENEAPAVDFAALHDTYPKPKLIARLVDSVLQHNAPQAQSLRDAAERQDLDAIIFLAHALQGVGGNLKAQHLRTQAAAAVAAGRQGSPDACALAHATADALDAVVQALELHRAQAPAP